MYYSMERWWGAARTLGESMAVHVPRAAASGDVAVAADWNYVVQPRPE